MLAGDSTDDPPPPPPPPHPYTHSQPATATASKYELHRHGRATTVKTDALEGRPHGIDRYKFGAVSSKILHLQVCPLALLMHADECHEPGQGRQCARSSMWSSAHHCTVKVQKMLEDEGATRHAGKQTRPHSYICLCMYACPCLVSHVMLHLRIDPGGSVSQSCSAQPSIHFDRFHVISKIEGMLENA